MLGGRQGGWKKGRPTECRQSLPERGGGGRKGGKGALDRGGHGRAVRGLWGNTGGMGAMTGSWGGQVVETLVFGGGGGGETCPCPPVPDTPRGIVPFLGTENAI